MNLVTDPEFIPKVKEVADALKPPSLSASDYKSENTPAVSTHVEKAIVPDLKGVKEPTGALPFQQKESEAQSSEAIQEKQ